MNTLLITHLSAGLIAFILGAFTHFLYASMNRRKALQPEAEVKENGD